MFNIIVSRKGTQTPSNYTITTAAAMVAAKNGNRKSITFQNQGSGTIYLGTDVVTSSGPNRGYALFAGATFTDNATDGEWWAVGTGSDVLHVIEVT